MDCAIYRSEIADKNTPLIDGRHNDGINGFDTLVRQCGPCGKGMKIFHPEHARKLCAGCFDAGKPVCPGKCWDRRKVQ